MNIARGWQLVFSMLIMAVLISGCQRTLFESIPTSSVPACDAGLVGHWLSVDDDPADQGELQAFVSSECAMRIVERRNEGPRESQAIVLRTSALGKTKVLLVDAQWANASFDVDAGPLDQPGDFYMYAYTLRSGNRLQLLPVDHRALAERAIANKLKADVLLLDGSLAVRVRGDGDAQTEQLRRVSLFDRSEPLNFIRADVSAP